MATHEQIIDPDYPDAIVEEVRRVRSEISAEFGHDFLKRYRHYWEMQIQALRDGHAPLRRDARTGEMIPATLEQLETSLRWLDSKIAERDRGEAA